MESEFIYVRNGAISKLGFEVSFGNGHTESILFMEAGRVLGISSEMGLNNTVILFVNQIDFPTGTSDAEKRRIFECVVRAIWFGMKGWKIDVEHGRLPAELWALPAKEQK
jgi:hypothetical protein